MAKRTFLKTAIWCLTLLAPLLPVAVSCSGKKAPLKPPARIFPSIIHPLFFQEEIAAQLNFPFWFNDSIIRTQGLQAITWTTFSTFVFDPDQPANQETYPKIRWIFHFDEGGAITSLERIDYSEGIQIASQHFTYGKGGLDGFREVSETARDLSREIPDAAYVQLRSLKPKKNVIQFDHRFEDIRYHFFPRKKLWGALSVDSIAHPGGQDWVIWGTPSRPERRYQVTNTVRERNSTRYQYYSENYPSRVSWKDYPFTQWRTYSYSPKGVFNGFIDSTFIDGSFVTRTVTLFKFDQQNRPDQITHQKGHASGSTNYRTLEEIKYTRFERANEGSSNANKQ